MMSRMGVKYRHAIKSVYRLLGKVMTSIKTKLQRVYDRNEISKLS